MGCVRLVSCCVGGGVSPRLQGAGPGPKHLAHFLTAVQLVKGPELSLCPVCCFSSTLFSQTDADFRFSSLTRKSSPSRTWEVCLRP